MRDIDEMIENIETLRFDAETGSVRPLDEPFLPGTLSDAPPSGSSLQGSPSSAPLTGQVLSSPENFTPEHLASLVVDETGKALPNRFGALLGKGRTSAAIADLGDQTKAFRLTRMDDVEAIRFDEFGRKRLEALEEGSNGLFEVTKRYGEVSVVRDSNGNKWLMESVEKAENTAKNRLAAFHGGEMTDGQRAALAGTVSYLNRKGFAWTDNHFENFDLVPLGEDKWRVKILDTGGVLPARGKNLRERYENARAIQLAFNDPPADWTKSVMDTLDQMRNAQDVASLKKAREQLKVLTEQRVRDIGVVVNDKIDYQRLGLDAWIGAPRAMIERPGYRALLSMEAKGRDTVIESFTGVQLPPPPQ